MRILVICQYFPPDITAAAFRMFDTARLLEAGGHEVRVITGRPHRSQAAGESPEEYDRQISAVARTPIARLTGASVSNYLWHYTSFMLGSSWLGGKLWLGRWRPDVVWASSPPLFAGLSGVAVSRLFRVPLVLDIRDIWPASAVGAGQLAARGRAYRFGEKMETYVYDRAAHITCVARPMQEYIRTRTRTPVTVVYNGARAADIGVGPAEGNGSARARTLLYAGNLGRAQQLDLLIRAWAGVQSRNGHDPWSLKLLGAGAMEKSLKTLAEDLGARGTIVFAPPVSHQEALREMRQATALCVNLHADESFARTIPSKVFDCLAVGRPILAGIAGEGRDILESTGANICYPPGDQGVLEQSLERLIRNYESLQKIAYRNPDVIRAGYTREKSVAVLAQVFASVTSRVRPGPKSPTP